MVRAQSLGGDPMAQCQTASPVGAHKSYDLCPIAASDRVSSMELCVTPRLGRQRYAQSLLWHCCLNVVAPRTLVTGHHSRGQGDPAGTVLPQSAFTRPSSLPSRATGDLAREE